MSFRKRFLVLVGAQSLCIGMVVAAALVAYGQFTEQKQAVTDTYHYQSAIQDFAGAVYFAEIALAARSHDPAADVAALETARSRIARDFAALQTTTNGHGERLVQLEPVGQWAAYLEAQLASAAAARRSGNLPSPIDENEAAIRRASGAAATRAAIDQAQDDIVRQRADRETAQGHLVRDVVVAGVIGLAFIGFLSGMVWHEFGRRERAERDRDKSEARREEAERLVEVALAHSPVALLVFDEHGDTRAVAGQIAERLERFAGERRLSLRALPPRYEVLGPYIRGALDGSVIQATVELDPYVYDMFAVPLRQRDGGGAVLTFWDVTERDQAADARRRAEQLQSLSLVAAGVSHDLNNAIVATTLALELAMREKEPAAVRNLIGEARSLAGRAGELGRSMRTYTGHAQGEKAVVEVSTLVESVVPELDTRGGVVRMLARPGPLIHGDPVQIRQLITNLVLNAAEATELGGEVTVSTGEEIVTSPMRFEHPFPVELPAGRYFRLKVSDTGTGMEAETLSHAFEPFFTTRFTGRGLGLAAVLGIVRGHGGAIRADSVRGAGTTVTVYLPADEAAGKNDLGMARGYGTAERKIA